MELSCRIFQLYGGINVHLLVRDFVFDDENILNLVKEISLLRLKKIGRMVDLVEKIYGIKIKKEEIDNVLKHTKSFGKPHIFAILS